MNRKNQSKGKTKRLINQAIIVIIKYLVYNEMYIRAIRGGELMEYCVAYLEL